MTLSELLKQSAEKTSSKTALILSGRIWTYSDLQTAVLKVAQGFQQAGIQQNDKVLILLKNCPEYVISIFALSHIGACAVPINFYQTAGEISFICSDSKAIAVVTHTSFLQTIKNVQSQCPYLKTVWCIDSEEYINLLQSEPIKTNPACENNRTMLILYTSGTTGNPKGVMLSHQNLTSNVQASIQALELKSKDRFLCILPMFHVFAWTANVLVPLYMGSLIVIVESIRPPKPWLELMRRHKITVFGAVPQVYSLLAEQAKGWKRWILKYLFFRTVRLCISGSAPLSIETLEKFEQRIGVPLLEGYGLTETSPVVCANTLRARKNGSVGKPVPGVKIKIINENGQELSANQEGEICISGPNVMQGYYEQPDATKEAFTPDGWFKTGDLGIIDRDGFLYIKDRIKDMIIVKGLKVFSIQVEQVLLSHPAVSEAAVVGIPDVSGDELIKGFVVLKNGAIVSKTELMKLCQDKLAPYKRPRDIEIRKELPKNSLQKVLKRQLRGERQRAVER